MSCFQEFTQMLHKGKAGEGLRELIGRIAEILDEHEDRIKKLEEKTE